ncbi:SCO7613 C-terminal domain-containing membrane protein, partial [Nocardiopsis halotolerans]|uniref:SCO7613 C-terminal domain-containing membrane protein n=1 Tax=Nocardiopsis halotolerans TaxID=124252 RepID=UPI00037AE8F9
LALLLLPTVLSVLVEDGMTWRVPAVLVLGLAVAVWGLRQRLQAALVLGGLVLVMTSLRAFGPPLWDLTRFVPNWVPFAVAGVLLLVIGARYEANLERLRRLGRWMAGMR